MQTLSDILQSLTTISNAELQQNHYDKYLKHTLHKTNDRGAALIVATNIEDVLQKAIEVQLGVSGKRKDLFGNKSPIGTFDYKIKISEILNIIGKETKHNLIIIKAIRNAFAHAKVPIDFKETTIKNACDMLKITIKLPPVVSLSARQKRAEQKLTGRKRFERVCDITAHNLFIRMLTKPQLVNDAINVSIGEDNYLGVKHLDVWLMPKPLP